MMNSYKVQENPLMLSNSCDKINSQTLSIYEGKSNSKALSSYNDKISSLMTKAYRDKISSLMTKTYRDKGNLLILNDFKIYEGKALMINCQLASERRCCSYD